MWSTLSTLRRHPQGELSPKGEKRSGGGDPCLVSECGLCDASGSGGVDENSAREWFALLKENHVSFLAWSLCNKNETSALIKPDCAKLSGWAAEDLSQSGKLFRDAILDG